ncbi:Protein of unknown function [Bizionia echini]|uniref:DUF3667 domain-containing protein n=1 Tax=Bizionia echini TaxID=649333 RepID=A0A1I5ARW7_9FLAO|nr:DUF3667 domain-containing protein [Bizionia echini]SFN64949.1 Protein of unknown function [Bizionia echini]
MTNSKHTCKNCEKTYSDSFAFCPHCGQKRNDQLTLKVLFYNTISNYFSFDARFFKSFFPLMLKPGFLAKKFIEGKRLLYLHPAQMYLFISLVFFFLFSFVEKDQAQQLDATLAKTMKKERVVDSLMTTIKNDSIKQSALLGKILKDSLERGELRKTFKEHKVLSELSNEELDSIISNAQFETRDFNSLSYMTKKIDSLIDSNASEDIILKEMGMTENDGYFTKRAYSQSLKFYQSKKGSGILRSFYGMIPIAMFFLLPIFAFILKMLHLKRGTYAHHLVFSFYYFAYLFTTFSIIIAINLIWDIYNWIDFLIIMSTSIYLLLALKYFYNQGWIKTFIKWCITIFIFLSIVTPVTTVFLIFYAFLFY